MYKNVTVFTTNQQTLIRVIQNNRVVRSTRADQTVKGCRFYSTKIVFVVSMVIAFMSPDGAIWFRYQTVMIR